MKLAILKPHYINLKANSETLGQEEEALCDSQHKVHGKSGGKKCRQIDNSFCKQASRQ